MVCCCSCRSFTEIRRDLRKDAIEVTVTSKHTGFLEEEVRITQALPLGLRSAPPGSLIRITIEHTILKDEQVQDMINGCKKKKIVSLTLTDVMMTRAQMITLREELPFLIETNFTKVFICEKSGVQPDEPRYFFGYAIMETRQKLSEPPPQPPQIQEMR